MRRRIVLLAAPLLAIGLGSCSYIYDLKAVMIDGRVAFVVDPNSRRQADCIRSIYVAVNDGGPIADPAEGDQEGLVTNGGAYWWDFRDVRSCDNPFPIFYGDELKGRPSDNMGYVAPKPLVTDVVYQVGTGGSGSGSGTVWFKIRPDGQIENYQSDPTPPIRDADGYVVERH